MIRLLATAMLISCTAPAIAQGPATTLGGMNVLPAGTPVRGTSGAPGGTDMYVLATLPGERHTFTLRSTSAKPVELLFIDPAGNVVVSKSGLREVKLDAVPSYAETYAVAVVRADTTIPYTLQRSTVPTSIERIMAAMAVGYEVKQSDNITEVRCWLKPGEKARRTYPKSVEEVEVLPGALFGRQTVGPQAGASVTTTYKVEGNQVVELARGPKGENTRSFDLLMEYMEQNAADKFVGYAC